ncbi:MAG: hypothetical protein WBW32_13120 [Luteibacter sp.]
MEIKKPAVMRAFFLTVSAMRRTTRWVRLLFAFLRLTVAAARRLTGVPVIVLQANHDEVIPAARTEALVHALPEPPVQWLHVEASHNTILSTSEMCAALGF